MLIQVQGVKSNKTYNSMETYFDLNIKILKICGLWVPDRTESTTRRYIQFTYNFLLNFYSSCLFLPTESATLFLALNLGIFVRSLRDQFNHQFCIYKIIRWFTYRTEILEIMNTLKSDEYNSYEKCEGFDPDTMIKYHKLQADRWLKLFLFGVNFICLNMCLSVSYILIFHYKSQYEENGNGDLVYAQKLPVFLITPFKMETRMSFVLHFIFEIFPLAIYGWMIVGLDCFFTTLMSAVAAHLTILGGAFTTIRTRCLQRLHLPLLSVVQNPLDDGQLNIEMNLEFNKCVKHLQMLISVTQELERIYYIQTCAQVMVSLFEMCFCLFLLSTSINANFGNEVTYLFSTAFELLLYCWFGNAIIEASAEIPSSIFYGDWLSATKTFKKSMLITMIRLKKPLYISIGKFTPLTFTTFLSIARVAYSFFTVLRSDALSTDTEE